MSKTFVYTHDMSINYFLKVVTPNELRTHIVLKKIKDYRNSKFVWYHMSINVVEI